MDIALEDDDFDLDDGKLNLTPYFTRILIFFFKFGYRTLICRFWVGAFRGWWGWWPRNFENGAWHEGWNWGACCRRRRRVWCIGTLQQGCLIIDRLLVEISYVVQWEFCLLNFWLLKSRGWRSRLRRRFRRTARRWAPRISRARSYYNRYRAARRAWRRWG